MGAGTISEQHLWFLQRSARAELVAVCDRSDTLSGFTTRRFGGRPFTDLRDMLDATRPEVVHVLTPAVHHVPMAIAALGAGAHVVVEKPMSLGATDRQALLDAARRQGRTLVEDHNYRFNRPMLKLQAAIAAGDLGEITDVDVVIAMPLGTDSRYGDLNAPSPSHGLPAGFIHEFITHLAYLGLAVDPDLELVEARWSKRVPELPARHDELDATLASKGAVGRLRFTAVAPRATIAVRATGTVGAAEAELINGTWRLDRPRSVGAQLSPPINLLLAGAGSLGRSAGFVLERLQGRSPYEGLLTLLERTYQALQDGGPVPVSEADMQRTGSLVDRLIETVP